MSDRGKHVQLKQLGECIIPSSMLKKVVCSPEALAAFTQGEMREIIEALSSQLKTK